MRTTTVQRVLMLLIPFLLLCEARAAAKPAAYAVTTNLNPFFTDPVTGQDLTEGRPLKPISGLFRGADGWLYAVSSAGRHEAPLALLRINPATGHATVVVVVEVENMSVSFQMVPDGEGRIYFTVREQAGTLYQAPGFTGPESCDGGCVLLIDTVNHRLSKYYEFGLDEARREGNYPDLLEAIDTDGALYVSTSSNNECADGSEGEGALVKVPRDAEDGTGIVLEAYGCDEPSVPGGGTFTSYPWQFSNDLSYRWWLQSGLYHLVETALGSSQVIATLAPSLGAPNWELTEGSGYIYGITCCGGTLNGGVILRVRVPSLASPDLLVAALSSPPATAAPGASFEVTETVENSASEPAAKSVSRFYLSLDGTHADVRLAKRYVPELWPSETSSGTTKLRVPANTPIGEYWLVECADAVLDVLESDEANNCRSSESKVLVSPPDLVVTAVTDPPAQSKPGAKFTVNDTVANIGNATAVESTTRYYLSPDTSKGAGDVLLAGARPVAALAPAAESSGSRVVAIPSGAALGTYYLLACADDSSKMIELVESNNCRASAGQIIVGH